MSPSFTKAVAQLQQKLRQKLRVRPDRVELLFAPGELKLRRLSAQHGEFEQSYALNENSWQAADAALGLALAELNWRGAQASVRLSNHFVRYALVTGSAKLRNRAERIAAARHQLHALYGEAADGWLVVPAAAGTNYDLAAAVDSELIRKLAETVTAAGLRLQRIEPALVSAFNNARNHITRGPTWLVTTEQTRLCIAYFDEGQWRLIRNERLHAAVEDELPRVLERLILAESVQPGRVLFPGATTLPQLGPDWSAEVPAPLRKKAA